MNLPQSPYTPFRWLHLLSGAAWPGEVLPVAFVLLARFHFLIESRLEPRVQQPAFPNGEDNQRLLRIVVRVRVILAVFNLKMIRGAT